jgi:hypothetical protein
MSLCPGEEFKQGWVGDMLPFLRKNILEEVISLKGTKRKVPSAYNLFRIIGIPDVTKVHPIVLACC